MQAGLTSDVRHALLQPDLQGGRRIAEALLRELVRDLVQDRRLLGQLLRHGLDAAHTLGGQLRALLGQLLLFTLGLGSGLLGLLLSGLAIRFLALGFAKAGLVVFV